MSRKGNFWDNAVVASFFSSLKMEVVHTRSFRTREEARRVLFDYIEVFYKGNRGYVEGEGWSRRDQGGPLAGAARVFV